MKKFWEKFGTSITNLILVILGGLLGGPGYNAMKPTPVPQSFATTPTAPDTLPYTLVVDIVTGAYDTLYTDVETTDPVPGENSYIVWIEIIKTGTTYTPGGSGNATPAAKFNYTTWLMIPWTGKGHPDLKRLKKAIPDDAEATGKIAFINQ